MNRFRLSVSAALAVVLSLLALHPAKGMAETLEEALARAYQGNPTLLGQRASVRAADEDMAQAVSGFRPSLNASASVGDKTTTNKVTGVETDLSPESYTLSLSQSLYAGGRTLAAIDEARSTIMAARAALASVEQEVLADVVAAYMNVVRDQAVLSLNEKNEDVLRRQLQATRDRFEVGEITRTDVHLAEARLARATASRIQARGDLESSRASYAKIVGGAPEGLVRPVPPTDLPTDMVGAINRALEAHPDVIEAMHADRAATAAIDKAVSDLLPSVDLAGSASRTKESSAAGSDSESLSATVTLTVPLYQSGSSYSKVRQAKQTAANKRHALEAARRAASERASKAMESLTTVQARIESIGTQIRAAETALEGVKREASVGSRTVLDVLDAEQELLDARVDLVSAQRDEMVVAFALKAAVGELTANALKLNVNAYDPDSHYREVRGKFFGVSSSGQ